jgi:hypothetical protein
VALHETVAVPDPVMLLGLIDPQLRPDGMVSVRDTVPENPLSAVIVTVEVLDWPALVGAGEVAEAEKSGGGVLKNSVIAVAAASLDVRVGRFQLTSIVLVREY